MRRHDFGMARSEKNAPDGAMPNSQWGDYTSRMAAAKPPRGGFPERLRAARERQGWSQAELAERAGFQPSAISRFESGAAKPSFANLRRLAEVLDVSTDYLLGLVEDPLRAAEPGDPLYRQVRELSEEHRALARRLIADLAELGKKK